MFNFIIAIYVEAYLSYDRDKVLYYVGSIEQFQFNKECRHLI